ncbi:MAG: hypothetical protein AAB414_04265 [Patescibacteria group bacterium]
MALSAEFQRHIEAAIAANDDVAREILESHKRAIEADEAAEKFIQLSVVDSTQAAPKESNDVETPEEEILVPVTKLTVETFRDRLTEDLKSIGREINLPEPSPEIVEVYNILAGEGYEVVPIAYVDGRKKEVRIGVFETVARPDYTDGSQMYYSGGRDPLAGILTRGRTETPEIPQRIAHPYRNVPLDSRFAVSWDEIHNYVIPEAIQTTSHLAEQLTKGGISFDIPNRDDFRSAGKRHEDQLVANSWEWVLDDARFGSRRLVGYRGRGGLEAVDVWPSGHHGDDVGFRVQAVSHSQELPR